MAGDSSKARTRRGRPDALVVGVTAEADTTRIRFRLAGVSNELHPRALVAVSRHGGGRLEVPLERTDDAVEAALPPGAVLGTTGLLHDTLDLHVALQARERCQDLRLRCTFDQQPVQKFWHQRRAVTFQVYSTVNGYASLRVGAGSPPGAGPDLPRGRGPVPHLVEWLVRRWLSHLVRRHAATRSRAPLPLHNGRPYVYFVIRSVYGMGGTVRTVVNTANHLAARGHPVTIISLLRPRDKPAFSIDRRIRVVPLMDERSRRPSAGLRSVARRSQRLLAHRVVLGRLDGWQSLLTHPRESNFGRSSLLTDVLLVRALQRLKPGVVVSTRPALNVVAAQFAPPYLRTVGQEHMNFSLYPRDMLAWMLAAYPGLDLLTVLTDGDARDYGEALADAPVRVRKIPNGLLRLPDRISDQSAPVVLAAGRLTRQKGFDLLIRAFARVATTHPDWSLRIFGSGPEQDNLQRLIEHLGITEHVQLMGRTSDMEGELVRGSLYALSSRFEGFGMVIIEAMAAGLPVVSFDCPRGPGDIITSGRDGLLVAPEDVDALADSLGDLIADEPRRRQMAEAARATAKRYTMQEVGKEWDAALGELADAQ